MVGGYLRGYLSSLMLPLGLPQGLDTIGVTLRATTGVTIDVNFRFTLWDTLRGTLEKGTWGTLEGNPLGNYLSQGQKSFLSFTFMLLLVCYRSLLLVFLLRQVLC